MTATRPRVVFCAAALLLAGCGNRPQLDVTAEPTPARASANAGVAAPPIAPDAELPPGHPPLPGSAGVPPGHPEIPAAGAQGLPMAAGGGEGDQAVTWTAPAGWREEPPANGVRRAQYGVPGPAGDAELVVFYFGPGQGGDPQANAERWAAQFVDAQGAPAKPRTRAATVAGMDVLHVEAEGAYLGSMGAAGTARQDGQALLAAVVTGPDANWFFKLTGPKATIEAQRAAFESLIASLRRGEA
jgi:hypothetical protein